MPWQNVGLIADEHHEHVIFIQKNIDIVNKHLAAQRGSHMAKNENPTTEDEIQVDVSRDEEGAVCKMLLKHKNMWSAQLG